MGVLRWVVDVASQKARKAAVSDRSLAKEDALRAINKVLEDHFPANGFRNLSQYRKAKDALTRLVIRNPSMFQASVLKVVQVSLSDSANILLEELMAARDGVPVELPASTGTEPPKMIEGECKKVAEVVPYRKQA